MYVPATPANFPSPRWDFHIFCACACRVAVSLSTAARLPSHRAPSLATQLECVLTLKISHRPDGKNVDALASTLACTTANDASVNYSGCVLKRPRKFPSPRWEFLLTCPIDSHLSIRIDIWFYQGYVRASHTCKLPIAPMGKLLTHLLRLACTTAADAPVNYSAPTPNVYVPQRREISPLPRWENC